MSDIYSEILKSKKYANTTEKALRRICAEAESKYPKSKDAVKAVKKEIHIINDSYLFADCHKKAYDFITDYNGEDISKDKSAALTLMTLHASSKERTDFVEQIYEFLSSYVDKNTVLGDIGCGFAPFLMPFFRELPKEYRAYEMNNETVDLLNFYFGKINSEYYKAEPLDAVSENPDYTFDTVFLFKILPVLQQQKKGRAFSVLKELKFSKAVISFPLKSLSGKNKGMNEFYSEFFENGIGNTVKITDKREIGNELFYVIEKIKKLD